MEQYFQQYVEAVWYILGGIVITIIAIRWVILLIKDE